MRQLLRRISFYLVALWASVTLNFLIPRLIPGNPAQALIARFQGDVDPQSMHALEILFGISHESLWTQYWQYLGNLLHGDLGLSITFYPTSVSQVIAEDLPWTLGLVGLSVVISAALGTLLGIIAAWRRGSMLDTLVPPLLTCLHAIPYFWLALLLLYLLGFILNWFPVSGGYDSASLTPGPTLDFLTSVVSHGTLPALTIVLSSMAGWMLRMRNTMMTTLSEDYVLMAEAKGLPQRRVMLRYAARNAILPNVTGFALSLGFVVAGALFTEVVFSYPGIGFALLQGIQNSDYALVQGLFLIIAVAVLIANFFADVLYTVLDPRTR
ncbi:MAG TPA: ABC transporter permease [Ktedonosporobacter sp.]|nr:ABC transporter permease [Ktedonosporobacter sp.]